MRNRLIPLFFAFSILFSHTLISCSDPEIHSSDIPEISQSIFVVPEAFRGEPYTRYQAADKFYINVNEKIRICGVYSINDNYITLDNSIPYYNTHKWIIDGDESSASSIYYSFNKTGIHNVSFETIDHMGDTLFSEAQIYVGSPSTISLQSPANHYNQVDGDNKKGIELSWGLSGIDPWETHSCIVYASYDKSTLWKSPLGEADCIKNVNLFGTLDADINEMGDSIDHSIDNSTIYWGVEASIKNEEGISEHVFSEIFDFSTKLKNDGAAIIEIPAFCKSTSYPEQSLLTGTFISAAGDTLSKITNIKANTIIKKTLIPQSNIKIVICNSTRTEYGCDSMTVTLAPSTKFVTDTLFLYDKVKPNMLPVNVDVTTAELLKFSILDNGSGINSSKIKVFMDNDTIQTNYKDNILSIPNSCKKDCRLIISAEDYAHNKVPDVYWKIKVNGSQTKISGPFVRQEDET